MRSIRISIPSGKVKLVMWEGTEDEAAFPIRAIGSRNPYITAYGIRYDLTDEEISVLRGMTGIAEKKT